MLRGGLRSKRPRMSSEDVNPMEGAVNIVDAMLVFSCGLMLSLVIYWNIDIKREPNLQGDSGAVTEVQGAEEEGEAISTDDGEYQKVGSVYVDPKTGKMYLVSDDTDE